MNFISALSMGALTVGGLAFGGSISITTNGSANLKPEFVSLSVAVSSKCYPRSMDAAQANAELANNVEKVMKAQLTDAESKLADAFTKTGGEFQRVTEQRYVNNTTEIVCENGWKTSKILTMKLAYSEDLGTERLPKVQDAILSLVDQNPQAKDRKEPQTWADFETPIPGVCRESRTKMQREALKDAIANAKSELRTICEACPTISAPKLRSIALPESAGANRNVESDYARMSAAPSLPGGPASSGSSYHFGDLTESVRRTFTFEFDGGSESCPVPTTR